MLDAELRLNAVDLLGQTLAGRYRLDALLDVGRDRMLWRAHDLTANKTVSLQVWPKGHGPGESELNAGILREQTAVHEVFARIEACGVSTGGQAFGVYPELEGQYLSTWLEERVFDAQKGVAIAAILAEALAALHRSGHVHGALESAVVVHDGERVVVRVVDAGLTGLVAVPHGAAVKAEITKVGALLASIVEAAPSRPADELEKDIGAIVARTRDDADAFGDMQALADALAAVGQAPRERAGGRIVANTLEFGQVDEGPSPLELIAGLEGKSVEAGEAADAQVVATAEASPSGLAEAGEAVDAQVVPTAEASPSGLAEAGEVVTVPKPPDLSELPAVSELEAAVEHEPALDLAHVADPLGLASSESAPEREVAQALPEEPALVPAPPSESELPATAGPIGLASGPLSGATPRPATVQMAAWPEKKRKIEPAAVVVTILLLATIAVFVFVLLPQPDQPATPLEALKVPAADTRQPVAVATADTSAGTTEPDVTEPESDTAMAVLDVSLEEEDTGPEPSTPDVVAEVEADTIEPDTVEVDTAITAAPDTVEVDTAIADTAVEPDTVVPPDTVVADTVVTPDTVVADTVVTPDTTIAAPDTAKEPEPDEVPDTTLPVRQNCTSKDEIKTWLAKTEDAIKAARRDGKGAGVTKPLQTKLLAGFKDGQTVTIKPYQIYYVAMHLLNAGSTTAVVGQAILSEHE